MIVKCIKTFNSDGTLSKDGGFWVHIGKEYQVFALRHRVNSSDDQRLECLIVGEDHYGLTMQNMEQFEIVSDYIPSNWAICRDNANWICLVPRSWHDRVVSGRQWEFVDQFCWDPEYDFTDGYELDFFINDAEKIISEEKEYLAKKNAKP